MIKVLKYPHRRLARKSTPVKSMAEARQILKKLDDAIAEQVWGKVLGFAAPQIGIDKRVFRASGIGYINPEIVWMSKGWNYCHEGCYSLEQGRYDYEVVRQHSLILKWTDEGGVDHEERFNGKRAQIIQHEYDHLEGKLANSAEEAK